MVVNQVLMFAGWQHVTWKKFDRVNPHSWSTP
jgi:hypothetical protein